MSKNSIESFKKAIEELLTRQRVGIGFAIIALSLKAPQEKVFASSRFFLVLPRKATGKSPKESEEL